MNSSFQTNMPTARVHYIYSWANNTQNAYSWCGESIDASSNTNRFHVWSFIGSFEDPNCFFTSLRSFLYKQSLVHVIADFNIKPEVQQAHSILHFLKAGQCRNSKWTSRLIHIDTTSKNLKELLCTNDIAVFVSASLKYYQISDTTCK